jgi:DinB superfamily
MKNQIENIRKIRASLLGNLNELTTEQFNKIPDGFGNNIIWNLAHLVAAQQSICYKRAGLDAPLGDDFINTYKPGTKPEKFVDAAGIEDIKQLLFSTLDHLEADYNTHIFNGYTPVTTRYGVELNNIDDGISFLPFHEGYHMGAIMGLKRLV